MPKMNHKVIGHQKLIHDESAIIDQPLPMISQPFAMINRILAINQPLIQYWLTIWFMIK